MRKVKFLLDWKDSRETEFQLMKLRIAREERNANAVVRETPMTCGNHTRSEMREVQKRKE